MGTCDDHPTTLETGNGDRLSVSETGGRFSLTLAGTPVLIPVIRGDGKSIETHLCTPNFGKDLSGIYGLTQHGQMRETPCAVTKTDDSHIVVTHEITDAPAIYPRGVTAVASFTLTDGMLNLTVTHTNTGSVPAPVNTGIHCYFSAPRGYRQTMINGTDVTNLIERTGNIDCSPETTIAIPGVPPLVLKSSGFSKMVLWVAQNNQGIFDNHYVCIEPVEFLPAGFGKPESMIAPGASRMSAITLSIRKAS